MSVVKASSASLAVPHFVRGRTVAVADAASGAEYGGFFTPALDLDQLIWPRVEPGPAFDVPVDEIVDLLVELGARLDPDDNEHMAHALEASIAVNPLGPRILEAAYRSLGGVFDRASLEFQLEQEVGRDRLDGWAEVHDPSGRVRRVRAFPPRLIHVLAGNTPGVTAITVVRGCAHQGCPSPQTAIERSLHGNRSAADPGGPRTRPPRDTVILVRVLAGWRRCD